MSTTANSINQNGCSVCEAGKENYTTFRPVHRPNSVFYQYDYRHIDGELFSTVAPTLEQCREKRDKWLEKRILFKGIDEAYKHAVVYTQVVYGKHYGSNANFFKSSDEAKKDASILKSISNKRFTNIHIVNR